MSFCGKCGSELDPDNAFCESCGATIPGKGAIPGQAVMPPSTASTPVYGSQGTPTAIPHTPQAGKSRGKAIILALLGLLVIGIIIVSLLGFALGPKWFVGDSKSGPEKVVDNWLRAMETKDVKLLMSTMSPATKEVLSEVIGYDYDTPEEMFIDMFFSEYQSIKFEGVKYKTTINGDKATVKITDGKGIIVDTNGNKTSNILTDTMDSSELKLIREYGEWYLDFSSAYSDAKTSAEVGACKDNLRTIDSAIMVYSAANNGAYPTSIEELVPTYLREMPKCSAGGKYSLVIENGFPRAVCSAGHTY